MVDMRPVELGDQWKERLSLSARSERELYESTNDIKGALHAGAMRIAFNDIKVSAIFCIQDIPIVVIVRIYTYNAEFVTELHAKLWNQGLANLLLVICDDIVRVFSLSKTPQRGISSDFEKRCLIDTLTLASDALRISEITLSAESGRFWNEYPQYFNPKEKVDQVLLKNLTESHNQLVRRGLSSEEAQALLIQTMFVAYLEDREIISENYFRSATDNKTNIFLDILRAETAQHLHDLFSKLEKDFNGDLFVAPCSLEPEIPSTNITLEHLSVLWRFRSGLEEMADTNSQLCFWGYDFKYIPVELISAVYDRFLGENEKVRRDEGAFYTPMFLADMVVSQVWAELKEEKRENAVIFDPACGSGVFLVRFFQRLCEYWRETRNAKTIRWDSLINILSRLRGCDINGSAVRIASFSLYIALLQEVSPPDIQKLIQQGRILPTIWGKALKKVNFFDIPREDIKADVIVGNPPWTSRRAGDRRSIVWCIEKKLPMPNKEEAWAFVWKALQHLDEKGVVAFLLPAMGFLHNHAETSIEARRMLFSKVRAKRIINFADLRFVLFDGAVRPTALVLYEKMGSEGTPYRIEYWAPKADLNAQKQGLITLSPADRKNIHSEDAKCDSLVFKRSLWMSEPEAKLFAYISTFPKLGDIAVTYGSTSRQKRYSEDKWIIGQGFQPLNRPVRSLIDGYSKLVAELPYLPVEQFTALVQDTTSLSRYQSCVVRRYGFEKGFVGPRILIPQGISVPNNRIRASYIEYPATFQSSIQAMIVPKGNVDLAKLFTTLLSSKLAMWVAFHGTNSFGSERPKINQEELLHLPFPRPSDLPDPKKASAIAQKLVAIIDERLTVQRDEFALSTQDDAVFKQIDDLVYQYFRLSDDEIILIEDTVCLRMPAIQPHVGTFPSLWKTSVQSDRENYADTLIGNLEKWLNGNTYIDAELVAHQSDLAILRLTIRDGKKTSRYTESNDISIADVLQLIRERIAQPLPGNFQLRPDFRVFIDQSLYLIKPMQKRFWLRSNALADADSIALDILQSSLTTRHNEV